MTNLNVALRAPGDSPSGGIVRAIPRTENRVVSGGGAIRHDGYSIRLNSGNGSQTGIGVLNFPANEFQEVEWSFEVHWDSTNKTVTFGPYTYGQISAAGVDSLDDLIGTEVLEYVATSTVIQRLEALEAGGGGGGGGGPVAWVDITGKPSTFPPATHGHPWSEITGKPTTFPPSSHTHGAGDLTGVVKTVNGTAPDSSGNVVVSGGGGGGTTYDSGGRNITSIMPPGWSYPHGLPTIRRVGKAVYFDIYRATADGPATITLPDGFKPWRPIWLTANTQIQFYPAGGATYWLDTGGADRSLRLHWLTDDAEPTTLPGSPLT